MNDYEIFLSKIESEDKLFGNIADQFGISPDPDSLSDFLAGINEPTELRIFVSNEDIGECAAEKAVEIFKSAEAKNTNISLVIKSDEFLNILDESGSITTESKPRSIVHRSGDFHPTVHIWIIKRMDMGIFTLLQKRSKEKDIHPDCYDVSAAGHVSQGDEFREAAVRELKEELGLSVNPEKLTFIGMRKNVYRSESINDNEFCAVYLYKEKVSDSELTLQASEVSKVCWAEIDEILSVIDRGDFKSCISADELKMIKKSVF